MVNFSARRSVESRNTFHASRLTMRKRATVKSKATVPPSNDPFRFQGAGVDFKAKLIGEREVNEPRGDAICAEAMRLAKANVKSSGVHKPRIMLNISIEGIKIRDEKTGVLLYNFPVSKISFIARDTTDARAFGFIFGAPDGKYKFYGTKTAQTADHAVLAIRDMFNVVYEMKKKQLEEALQKQEEQENIANEEIEKNGKSKSGGDSIAVADLLNLETEVETIQQGVNQLRSIPSMPEDDIFSTDWINSTGNSCARTNSTSLLNGLMWGNDSSNDSQKTDPFGDSFNSSSSFGNAFQSSLPSKNPFHIDNNVFSPPSLTPLQSAPSQQLPPATNGFHNNDAFGRDAWPGANPMPTLTNISSAPVISPSINGNGLLHSNGSNGFATNFVEDNCIERKISLNGDDWPGTKSFINKKPVTTLEEGFNKLVDMNSLVVPTANVASVTNPFEQRQAKNPFEHIVNPPKPSLNDLRSKCRD